MEPIHHPSPSRLLPEILSWRHDVLREAGVPDGAAAALAADADVDLHDVLALIDRGCPPALAARIVAPL